ncbi:MAG TPA: hypothetical protein VMC43_01605, partial [Candidatus Paceibacterota bacterium]|nr:hypothetical protein [Candidatus Paceibacterota bacterium]
MKIAILGFGREGQATLRYIIKRPEYRDADITILDKNKNVPITPGLKYRLGADYLKRLNDFDIVFRSPGIPWMAPELEAARKHGVK